MGRAAVEAWRALPPEARQRVGAASRAGTPVEQPEPAAVASGYAMTVRRWTSGAMLVVNLVMTVVMVCGWLSAGGTVFVGPMRPLLFGWIGLGLLVSVYTARWRKIVTVQQPVVDQAQVAAAAAPEGRSAAPDAVAEIVLRFDRLWARLLRLVTVVGLNAGLLGALVWLPLTFPGSLKNILFGATLFGLVVLLVQLGSLVLFRGGNLADPVLLRLRPDGWECPATGARGTWDEVTEVTVQPVRFDPRSVFESELLVALRVADPARYLAQVRGPRRRLAGHAVRRSGSPACFSVVPMFTAPVGEIVATIRRFTAVPVRWVPMPQRPTRPGPT
jgi:hypothetical protein